LLVINGASAGGFSPISVFGVITNGVVERNDLPGNPGLLWASSFVFNALLSVVVFFMFGGRELLSRRVETEGPGETPASDAPDAPAGGTTAHAEGGTAVATKTEPVQTATTLNGQRIVTLAGLLVLVVGALVFDIDVGLLALSIATVICIVFPEDCKASVGQVAWPTVLLICGVVTYVGIMQTIGTIDMLGESVAGIGVPLLAAFVICLIGAAVSAFASTTGILGALIPLAVPFLLGGEIGAVGMIIALAISSSVVDSSPFSTSGALVVASSGAEVRDRVFRGLMIWGLSMIIVAPVLAWAIFVAPGWL
jgi:di/tricarboxylate transporter